jgi:hypothetical protein
MFQTAKWKDIKERLVEQGLNDSRDAALMKCLNSIKSNTDVYTCEYGFQETIVENGELAKNGDVPETLRYAKVPLGIILNNAVEVFYKHNNEDILQPVRVLYPGDFVGTFEMLDILTSDRPSSQDRNKYGYSLTAGAKSILPSKTFDKPSQVESTAKSYLQATSRRTSANLSKSSKTLQLVLQAAEQKAKTWKVEIAFLPLGCVTGELRTCLFEHGWRRTQVLRHLGEPDVDKMFEYDHKEIDRRSRARDHASFLENIARDLYLIAHGQLPCFVPVRHDSSGPSLHSLLGPFDEAYALLGESNPRLEFLVPGYLDGAGSFGLYPLDKCCHKMHCAKPELSRACIDLFLYKSRHGLLLDPYELVPILSPTIKVGKIDAKEWRGIKYVGSKGGGASVEGGVDLEKLPFELGKGVAQTNVSGTPKPLYSNNEPITGSILIIKKGELD